MARNNSYFRLKLPIDSARKMAFMPLKLRKHRRIATKIMDNRGIDRVKVQEEDDGAHIR